MADAQVVFLKIAVMALIMVVGWWANRRGVLSTDVARGLGILVVEVSFPALIFVQMLRTVTLRELSHGWWIPVFAIIALFAAGLAGRLLLRPFSVSDIQGRSFIFLIATPNWVFLPLPIAESLYGSDGVRFVLLFNLGAQIALWTAAPALLQGMGGRSGGLRALLTNRGVGATVAGVLTALLWPGAASAGLNLRSTDGLVTHVMNAVMNALDMLGALTIPMSLLVTGGQLACLNRSAPISRRTLSGVLFGRLLLAPALVIVPLRLVAWASGWRITEVEYISAAIILSMPTAISCPMFIERYGGSRELGAMSILYSTLAGLVTVPLVVACCKMGGVW